MSQHCEGEHEIEFETIQFAREEGFGSTVLRLLCRKCRASGEVTVEIRESNVAWEETEGESEDK